MRIIFVSSTCSVPTYQNVYRKRSRPMLDSSQKFFDLFLRGLAKQSGVTVDCLSVLPVSRSCYPHTLVPSSSEMVDGIHYNYAGFLNFPVLKSITSGMWMRRFLSKYLKKHQNEKVLIVCDPLLLEAATACIKTGEKHRVKTVGFLTDLPTMTDLEEYSWLKSKMYRYYNNRCDRVLKSFDGYVFLTEGMNEYVNISAKPYLIMECLVGDSKKEDAPVPCQVPTILYAGKLHKQFGLDVLADAIDYVKSDCRFVLYGDGDYADELQKKAKANSKLEVRGVVPVDEVIEQERCSTLLINPRTSAGEFTKYSFPSKTAEYMLTGVPVLMFQLPGIPSDYDNFLFYAHPQTAKGLANAVDEILSMPPKQLFKKGQQAQQFVLANKHYVKQGERFAEFAQNCLLAD